MTEIKLQPKIDFGKMPIANGFLTPEEFDDEYFFDMILGYDPNTHAIGLVNTVPPEKMFHDHYAFFSSTSEAMKKHFAETANKLQSYAGNGLVVEIGSNDGIMLEAWRGLGVSAVGVEPSGNVAEISKEKGHDVIVDFMSETVVDQIQEKGNVSLVYGANVSCHIENFVDYIDNIAELIGKEGVFVFEDPYFLDIVEKTSYDQIYDEHVWYFTISFINQIVKPYGLHVFDCEHIPVHGGELRMYVGHKDKHEQKEIVARWLKKEEGLEGKIDKLQENIKKSKNGLLKILNEVKDERKNICGFAATSKATTVFNYCGIGPELIPFVTDTTPQKQGKYYPGVHIPVVSQDRFGSEIDYAFLGAWNHFEEIDKSQKAFRESGGKWITHVPKPRII